VRVFNEPESETAGAFGEFIQLQTEFHARLAEETLKYLRRVQGAAIPTSPGTVILPNGVSELRTTASPGTLAELKLEIENRQKVHCVVTPMLSPLVETSGVTWFPAVEMAPAMILLPPDQIANLVIRIALPVDIPAGIYRGTLLLLGFTTGGMAVTVEVKKAQKGAAARAARSAAKKTKAKAAKGVGPARLSSKKKAASKTRRRSPVKAG
jgi:hypothetical protein